MHGAICRESFQPPGGENALCSFHGNFVLMPDGKLVPLTTRAAARRCCDIPAPAKEGAIKSREFVALHWAAPPQLTPEPRQTSEVSFQPNLGEWDTFLKRARTHTFCISGMAFQDAWTLDLDRLRDCYIHVVSGADTDCRLVPFCAYNLTDRHGRALYRVTTGRIT